MPTLRYFLLVLLLVPLGCQKPAETIELPKKKVVPTKTPSPQTDKIAPKKPKLPINPTEARPPQKPVRGPNIVFILTDDQDRGSLRAMPRTRALFPFWFENHMLTDPVCCPSRETFMTGQYAHNHGVLSNSRQRFFGEQYGGWWAASSRKSNIGLWLQKKNYRTALLGKYLNGFDTSKPPPRGWDDTFLALGDREKGYFNYSMLDNGTVRSYGSKPEAYSSSVLTKRAISNMRRSQKELRPYFLFLSYNTPHSGTTSNRQPSLDPEPHPRDRDALLRKIPSVADAPAFNNQDPSKPEYMQRSIPLSQERIRDLQLRMRARWQSLYSLDREIARLVRAAERSHRPTYFFFTTDNGFFLGQHRLVGKFRPYEEATRFPLLVRTPDKHKSREQALIGNIDFVPTVLSLARAQAPQKHVIDGRSLLPFLEGSVRKWRREIVLETFPSSNEDVPYLPYVAIRGQKDVFIRYQKAGVWPPIWSGEEEYYDLRKDPYQLRNAIDDATYRARITHLRRRAEALRNCVGRRCP